MKTIIGYLNFPKSLLSLLVGIAITWLVKGKITSFILSEKILGLRTQSVLVRGVISLFLLPIFAVLTFLLISLFTSSFPKLTNQILQNNNRGNSSVNNIFIFFTSFLSVFIIIFFFGNYVSDIKSKFLDNPVLAPILIPALASILFFPTIYFSNLLSPQFVQKIKTSRSLSFLFLQKYTLLFTILFSAIIVFLIFGKSLYTKFGIIDDHEIFYFLGMNKRLPLNEFFSTIKLTEVGNFGSLPRYRPTYYFLRILECVLWGANSTYWYAFRLLILFVSVCIFWNLLSPHFGLVGGGILIAYTLTFSFWADVIGRLGPSENYIVLGLLIYIWGLRNVFRSGSTKLRYSIASLSIFIGAVLCIGSKENLVILIIPSAYVAYKALKLRRKFLLGSSLGSILFALYVGVAVLLLVTRTGTDVYSNSVNPVTRLLAAVKSYHTLLANPLVILGILILLLCVLYLTLKSKTELRRAYLKSLFWIAVLFLVCFSQVVFYQGRWPDNTRYDFPGILYIPAAIFVLFLLTEKICEYLRVKNHLFVSKTSFIIVLFLLIFSRGYSPIMSSIMNNINTTNDFQNKLGRIVSTVKSYPEYAIVLESGNVWDYEPIFSYQIYLRAYGVNNPIILRLHGYSPESFGQDLNKGLANTLINLSNNGSDLFLPLKSLNNFDNRCFSIDLSGSFVTQCRPIQ